jgi:hypothetical protein
VISVLAAALISAAVLSLAAARPVDESVWRPL